MKCEMKLPIKNKRWAHFRHFSTAWYWLNSTLLAFGPRYFRSSLVNAAWNCHDVGMFVTAFGSEEAEGSKAKDCLKKTGEVGKFYIRVQTMTQGVVLKGKLTW